MVERSTSTSPAPPPPQPSLATPASAPKISAGRSAVAANTPTTADGSPAATGSRATANGRRAARGGRSWRTVILVLLLLAVAAAVIWYFRFYGGKKIETVTVERGTVVRAFYATGVVRPDVEFVVKSRAQGTLLDLQKREGSEVKAGELLARVDDRQLKYEVERTRAELREAQAQTGEDSPQYKELQARLNEARGQAEIAERTLKRIVSSFEKGTASVQDVDVARRAQVQWVNTVAALESQLGTWSIESRKRAEVAEANVRKAEANLADTEVRSPVDGLILERYVENQEVVGLNDRLLLIARPEDKLMKASVDEEDITRTSIDQKVEMQLYAFQDRDRVGEPAILQGRVVEILPSANPVNKTYEVKVRFVDKPERLKVGMTGELNFIEEESALKGALIVPSSAVLDKKVYRPAGAGRFEPVEVKVGVRTLDRVEIREGLKEGEEIVADAKQVAPVKLPPPKQPVVPTRVGDEAGVSQRN